MTLQQSPMCNGLLSRVIHMKPGADPGAVQVVWLNPLNEIKNCLNMCHFQQEPLCTSLTNIIFYLLKKETNLKRAKIILIDKIVFLILNASGLV